MPPAALIDTGAILAIVDANDDWHAACLEALQAVQIPLFTTEAILTETFHLVGRNVEKAARILYVQVLSPSGP